jgi:hypothetical protein
MSVDPVQVCVVKNGAMANVEVAITPSGDTTVNGRPLHDAYPETEEYAGPAKWFTNPGILEMNGIFFKYGLPRVLGAGDVVPIGTYRGVTVFAEPSESRTRPIVVYLPVDPWCNFQPFEREEHGRPVRGDKIRSTPADSAAPAVPPSAPASAPPPPPAADGDLRTCVVKNGTMSNVEIETDPHTGDTTVAGRPFREVYPLTAEYAAPARWYNRGEPVVFAGLRMVRYGLPRALNVGDVVPVGTFRGVTVFTEPAMDRRRPEVIYLPLEPGCMFQPFQYENDAGAIRG